MTKQFPQRKSPRLRGYDYTQDGAYFITICTFQREHLFGDVVGDDVIFTEMGQIAHAEIPKIAQRTPYPVLDASVVMPNHVHMILILQNNVSVGMPPSNPDANNAKFVGTPPCCVRPDHNADNTKKPGHSAATSLQNSVSAENNSQLKPGAIGTIIRSYKSAITRRINQTHTDAPLKIWQSRYHDHIIRDEQSLNYIRRYVQYNPAKWTEDLFYGA